MNEKSYEFQSKKELYDFALKQLESSYIVKKKHLNKVSNWYKKFIPFFDSLENRFYLSDVLYEKFIIEYPLKRYAFHTLLKEMKRSKAYLVEARINKVNERKRDYKITKL